MTDTFFITPATGKIWLPVLAPLLITLTVFVVIACLSARSIHSARHAKFEVNDSALVITGEYAQNLPLENLDLAKAQVVNLAERSDLSPSLRTNGVGLPGYQAGWFNLQNGQKALLYLTSRDHVVYLPTNEGYSLLLSAADSGGLLDSLRRHKAQQE